MAPIKRPHLARATAATRTSCLTEVLGSSDGTQPPRQSVPSLFKPTFPQESFKSQLWDTAKREKINFDELLSASIGELPDVQAWAEDPAFLVWIHIPAVSNMESQLKALVGLSFNALSEVLTEVDPKFNGPKVSAARLILEAAKILSQKKETVVKDEKIARASKEELRALIRKHKDVLSDEADRDDGAP